VRARVKDDAFLKSLLDLAQAPSSTLEQFRSLAGARQYALLYALTRRHVPRGRQILDWGVGNGHYSRFLAREGYRTTGFSLVPCEFAEQLPIENFRFVQGSLEDPVTLPFPDSSFDAVASVGVLEHVRELGGDERASLSEIRRVLKPGGVFLGYHLPNRHSLIEQLASRLPGKFHHERRFTRHELERLCCDSGLTPVFIRRYGVLPRNTWSNFPHFVRRSAGMATCWDAVDALLGLPLRAVAQNFAVVGRAQKDCGNQQLRGSA
jgi:SAM-dependent methyltransferase